MTVWVVTKGCYSDYRIEAIFASKEESEAFINGKYHDDIEATEWVLGARSNECMQEYFEAYISIQDGHLMAQNTGTEILAKDFSASRLCNLLRPMDSIQGKSVISPEHAIKVATEGRQSYLRERAAKEMASINREDFKPS